MADRGGGGGARCPAGHQADVPAPRAGLVPRPRLADGSMRAWRGGWSWSAGRLDTARRSCWPTGPGAASSRWRGCRWTPGQRPGAVLAPRAAALDRARPGSPTGWARCSARPRRLVRGAVTALVNEFAAARRGVALLVLDDYHVIERPAGARVARVPARPPAGRAAPGAGQPQRPAAAAGAAAGPRPAGRAARGRPALHRRRRPPRCCAAARRRPCRSGGRGAGGRTEGWAAGLQLAALSLQGGRRRRVRRGVLRQPPLRAGLPHRGGARAPARGAADVPAGDLGPRSAVRPAVRRRRRPRRPARRCWSRWSGRACS